MKRGKTMLLNTLLLTATAILMRTVAMAFQVYLSKKIGASGIGLFQLIMSVSMLAACFAISGVRFATTRLVSEELGRGSRGGVKAAVRRCLIYALCFGTAASFALFSGADMIGTKWIGDERTVLSLRLLSLSLPAFSMSAVLSGYFTAVTRVIKSAMVQVAEQLVRIAVVVAALSLSVGFTVETACAIIVIGGVVGEAFSFLMLYLLYVFDRRRYGPGLTKSTGLTKRLLSISLPLAVSAYGRTALSTIENLLVPRGFKKSGASSELALADYGMIQGMVFPVIAFPSAFFYSLSELIVPELTEDQVNGRIKQISYKVGRLLYLCILFSFGVTAAFFQFAGELGTCIYQNPTVGYYIKALSFVMPIIFLDSITDGMLRGLGQQMHCMRYNILDSLISVVLVWYLLPVYAVPGFIFMIYFTSLFNFVLSLRRLYIVTKFHLPMLDILKSVVCAFGAVNITALFIRAVGLGAWSGTLSLTMHIILSLFVYAAMLLLIGCIAGKDIRWFKSHFSTKKSAAG